MTDVWGKARKEQIWSHKDSSLWTIDPHRICSTLAVLCSEEVGKGKYKGQFVSVYSYMSQNEGVQCA